ncbi:hypothetical protein PVK06_004827 [Gossypium arboreum]|uniref:Uncharacterized protein n=1 Tax=Gossypium arboreum TaxID=29729 RepID=A0ABR0QTZ0_GOSAR|nr:hypothetical protein PVK06_004827 [Gossypium arboreum]
MSEKVVDKREVVGTVEFENEDEEGRVRVMKTELGGGDIEDFFSDERVGLGRYQF